MSLDLYITSNTPVKHRGTGIFIMDNGKKRELKTKQEVLTYFPDVNPEKVREHSYEDNEYFHINITHNLTEMASACEVKRMLGGTVTLYDLMWHPKENLGITKPTMDYLLDLSLCYKSLLETPDTFKKLNSENGWGSYELLLQTTKEYLNALHSISDDFENYTIEADT